MSILTKSFTGLIGSLTAADAVEIKMKKFDTTIQKPVDTVSIIIPSLNEEVFIEHSLASLKNQSIVHAYPEYFEYILVDNGSKDRTVELGRPYVDKVLTAPRGKLYARNLGTDYSDGKIIVAVDSDIVYPYHWLNTLLKPLNNPKVVGVTGSTFDYYIPHIPRPVSLLASYINRAIIYPTRMIGGNSAYYKQHFNETGKFNTSINQLNAYQISLEEEIGLGKRLSKYGKIVFQLNASCMHLGGQRSGCRLGLSDKDLCEFYGISKERF